MNPASIARINRTDRSYCVRVAIDSRLARFDQMRLTAPVLVELADGRDVIIPAGFVTDCHSIPPILAGFLPEYDNRTNIAAIVHDYLYMHWEDFIADQPALAFALETQSYSPRHYTDLIYYELMGRFHPEGGWRNRLYYYAVRLLGGFNWRAFRNQNREVSI